jgi:hypothetical protein
VIVILPSAKIVENIKETIKPKDIITGIAYVELFKA